MNDENCCKFQQNLMSLHLKSKLLKLPLTVHCRIEVCTYIVQVFAKFLTIEVKRGYKSENRYTFLFKSLDGAALTHKHKN